MSTEDDGPDLDAAGSSTPVETAGGPPGGEDEAPFVPLGGDDLDRMDATGGCDADEVPALVQTALHHRQEAMDLRDEVVRLRRVVGVAAQALDRGGFCLDANAARDAVHQQGGGPLSPFGKSQGTVLERDVKDLAARPHRRCAACGGRGWRLDLDERCSCQEGTPAPPTVPEEER